MRISDWSSDVCSSDLEGQIGIGQREAHGPLFSLLEADLLEPLQLLHRPRHRTDEIANIKLHDLFAVARAAVRHRHAGGQLFARANARLLERHRRTGNGRIDQSIAHRTTRTEESRGGEEWGRP